MEPRIASPKQTCQRVELRIVAAPHHLSSRRGRDHGMTAEQASAALRSLMHDDDKKWFYAYAMGAGCTTEDNNEISVAIRRRDAELRAVIAEHREGS
jgi:hypothetical protein